MDEMKKELEMLEAAMNGADFWTDKEAAHRFSEAVIAAVERENPGQTSGDFRP